VRWRGEKSEAIRLAARGHTHALFALKVQRKVSNGVLDCAAAGSSLDRAEIAAITCHSAMQLGNQTPAQASLLRSWHTRLELRIPNATSLVTPGQLTGFFWRIGCKISHVAEGETRPIDCLVVGL
jgi:hypothetical protein